MKLLLLICTGLLSASGKSQGKIMVNITNFENNKGVCIACLYNTAEAFNGKGKPLLCSTVTISNKTATVVFENVPEGNYAVSVIHDANNNQKFDTNFLGIPKEGYGASQNKLPFAAAPKFDDNKFSLPANTTVTNNIKLRYIF